MTPSLFSTVICLVTVIVAAQPQDDGSYYDRCRPFLCGGIRFSFPFSDSATFGTGSLDCGLPRFEISCDPAGLPVLDLPGTPYHVRALYPDPEERIITVVNTQLIEELNASLCYALQNLTVPSSGVKIANLSLPQGHFNLTFFKCASGIVLPPELADATVVNSSCEDSELYLWMNRSSYNQSSDSDHSYAGKTPDRCKLVEVPVSDVLGILSSGFEKRSNVERWRFVLDLMREGFPLTWSAIPDCDSCQERGGRCGFDDLGKVVCLCDVGGCK